MIAILNEGIFLKASDLEPGIIDIVSVTPAQTGVQIVNGYTIVFITEHTLYIGATITIEFPTKIILPATGSTVVISAQGDSKGYFIANTGKVEAGNII
jgi:hypothetical protein